MKWSFKVGRLLGIELRIHLTFFLIVAWAAYIWGVAYEHGVVGGIYGAFVITVLFICVVIHEMAHSKMAEHYGADVASITLLPIGGVSQLKSMPEEPKKELWVSVVGPLTNLVIGAFLLVVWLLIPDKVNLATEDDLINLLTGISLEGFIFYMLLINIMLALFNLIPAFPLDGGRVLRSILSFYMPPLRATRIAKVIGQGFAVLLGFAGLMLGQIFWMVIAVFIFFAAGQEGSGAEMKDILSRLKVRQALTGKTDTVRPETPLSEVVALALHSLQEDFPVLGIEGQLVGILTRGNLLGGLHHGGPDIPASEVMEKEFPTVSPDADFSRVFDRMNETRMRAVPVVENGYFVGMITLEHLSEVFNLLSATARPIVGKSEGR